MSKSSSVLSNFTQVIFFFIVYLGSLYLGQFQDIKLFEYVFALMTIGMSVLWIFGGIAVAAYGSKRKETRNPRLFVHIAFPLWFIFFLIVGIQWYPILGLFGMIGIITFTLGIYTSCRGAN